MTSIRFVCCIFFTLVISASSQAQGPLLQKAIGHDPGGSAPMSVAVADLNGDGIPDMVVANQNGSGDGTVGVLLGKGNGAFQPVVAYDSGGQQGWSVAVADVNGDGHPDILVLNSHNSFVVGVLLGNGDGTFAPAVTYKGDGFSIAVADVNGDGKPDLITGSAEVLLGNGDGTFQPAIRYGSGAMETVVADVNGDGKPDIVAIVDVVNVGTYIGVLLGKGDGTFPTQVLYSTGGVQSYSVAVGDLNGDGKPDIVASNYCTTEACNGDGSVSVLLGNGDGTFQAATTYDSGGRFATSVALGDVNGDGKLDVMVGNAYCQPVPCGSKSSVGVLVGKGDGTFQPLVTYLIPQSPFSLTVADVNGGLPDLLLAAGELYVMSAEPEELFVSVNGSPNPALVNQAVTFTATLTPKVGRVQSGQSVSFYDGQTAIGTVTTVGGTATLNTSFSTKGAHHVKAKVAHGAAFKSSAGVVKEVVNP